jgi:hypothetical protein
MKGATRRQLTQELAPPREVRLFELVVVKSPDVGAKRHIPFASGAALLKTVC